MSRRSSGLGDMLNMMLKGMYESKAGRIRWYSNMWAIIGTKWDKNRLVNKNLIGSKHVNENGEWVGEATTLVKRQCTSNCPNPPGDDFYVDPKHDKAWVPATECRKCPFHLKAQQGGLLKFPRCTFNKSADPSDIAKATMSAFNGLVDEAIENINRL